MKKKRWNSIHGHGWRKIFLMMRVTIFFILAGLLQVHASVYSQQTKLQVTAENKSIFQVLKMIEDQSDFHFLYRSDNLKGISVEGINMKDAKIEDVLDKILIPHGLTYEIPDRTIVIKKSSEGKNQDLQKQPAKKPVSGKVTDEKGEPLPGVTIVIKGTTKGIITDSNGNFSFSNVPENSILKFSFVGMATREIVVGAKNIINVTLTEQKVGMDEVVVVGYGTVRKKDLTGSVGEVAVKDLVKAPVSSFAEGLAGRVSGVRVSSSDGQPGAGVNIIIRGTGTLTSSTQPLYVIDGVAVEDFDPLTLNQEEMESMTILKDASSTAIYGSRGANGVILIQTKRGSVGKPVVTFSGSAGYQQVPRKIEMMSPYEFLKYQMEQFSTSASILRYFGYDANLGRQKTLEDYKGVKGVDFQDYLLRTGVTQNYDISLRGGTNATKYSVSGSIYDLTGAIINTGLTRYTGRLTLDQTISKKFSAGVTVNSSVVEQNGQIVNQGQAGNNVTNSYLLITAWMYRPIASKNSTDILEDSYDPEPLATSDVRINPFLSQKNQHRVNNTNLLEASGYVTYKINKNLVFKTTGGYRNNRSSIEAFYNSLTTQGSPYNLNNLNGINGSIRNVVATTVTNSNTLTFNKTIRKKHTITALALFETSGTKTAVDGYSGRLLPNETLGISGIDEGTASYPLMSRSSNTLVSYAGRLNYNYKSRYLLAASIRADGSSKFVDHWGYFPSASAAWNMQSEPFFEKLFPGVSNSKLRLSYGSTGNNRIGDFDYAQLLTFDNTSQGYAFNNSTPNGAVYMSNVGNLNLKWETVKTKDAGYQLGLFKNKLTIEAEWYRKTTSDLLLNATLPRTTGFTAAVKNIGELRNEGWEFTVNSYNINSPKFKWQTNFNISFNKNKIMSLTDGQQTLTSSVAYSNNAMRPLYIAEVGRTSGMMMGYIWEGNYQYSDFDNPSPGLYVLKPGISDNGTDRNTIQPGHIKYKDLNGDRTIDDADVTLIGRGQPVHTGGFSNNFSYKGFELNVFFSWSYGNNVFNANRIFLEGGTYVLSNQYASYIDRWSPTNPTNLNFCAKGQGPIGIFSSKQVEDGSYLKLRTVSLSYSVPHNIIKKLSMSNLIFSVSGQNLYTWTNYSGLDPEVSTRGDLLTPGFDFSSYPRSPVIVFGIKAAF